MSKFFFYLTFCVIIWLCEHHVQVSDHCRVAWCLLSLSYVLIYQFNKVKVWRRRRGYILLPSSIAADRPVKLEVRWIKDTPESPQRSAGSEHTRNKLWFQVSFINYRFCSLRLPETNQWAHNNGCESDSGAHAARLNIRTKRVTFNLIFHVHTFTTNLDLRGKIRFFSAVWTQPFTWKTEIDSSQRESALLWSLRAGPAVSRARNPWLHIKIIDHIENPI